MASGLDEFAAAMLKMAEESAGKPFNPIPFLDRDGHTIEWYWESVGSYAELIWSVDGKQVGELFRSRDDNRVIGVCLHLDGSLLPCRVPADD